MNCPVCKQPAIYRTERTVKGLRYQGFPGIVKTYWCQSCAKKFHTLETYKDRLWPYLTKLDTLRREANAKVSKLQQQLRLAKAGKERISD